MIVTYLAILLCLYMLLRSFIELIQLIVYGNVPQKKELTRAFERLKGEKRSFYSTRSPINRKMIQSVTIYVLTGAICFSIFIIGLLLFRSFIFALAMGGLGLLYPKVKRKREENKRRDKMLLQFREAILSLASSLKAGASLQVALRRCEDDLRRELQFEEDKPMLEALEGMNRDLQLGTSVEDVFRNFRDEYDIEDIQQFVDATLMTKSKGGNMADVIYNTAQAISDKIMIQQEIKLATAQKRMETSVLTFMPVVIVAAILVMNPAYMQPMYDSWIGTTLLFVAAMMLTANFFIGRRITKINV